MRKFCYYTYLYLFRKKQLSLSIYVLSTEEIWHFDDNFVSDSKHILQLQTSDI